MKKPLLGIALASIILFSSHPTYGYTITYEKWGNILDGIPTACVIEPNYSNSEVLSESFAKRLMDETRISVAEWQVQLQSFERGRDKSMWEIKQIPVSLEKQEDFNYDKCTIFIRFEEKPESKDDWYKLLGKTQYEFGDTGRSDIVIYYTAIKFCKTDDKDWIYFDPCYETYPRLMQQLKSVIKHEFGHALGLGHYKADDIAVSIGWARGTIPAPSIMAVFSHQNLNENVITTKDIAAVRSMYGENGFIPNDDEIVTFDSFGTSSDIYIIPKGGYTTAGVEGLINEDQYLSGIQVEIFVLDPNQALDTRKVRVNSDGGFNYQTIIDENIVNGTYIVYAKYRDQKSQEAVFEIQYEGEEEDSKVPQWIKNSAKWWAQNKINELDFILGMQHLIREGVLNPPTPETQTLDVLEYQAFGAKIPKYVKQTSLWWAEGRIGDQEFVDGIQFLIKKGYLII